jgi:toxin-antitoxin system PIN domain toxin
MILPDVNVLINAFRPEMVEHSRCRRWLQSVVDGKARFGVAPLSLGAVVRVTTNRRTWSAPSSIEDAFRFCDYLLHQPHCQAVEPGGQHWHIFKGLCVDTDTRGPTVTDAWYAALAIEWGCEWITLDRDYSRFPGLHWRLPAAAP